ncbi:hypothetical protein VOLCADRAFT_96054 [Volvox carteri f. nagariensis]|uniref:Uncharacterized protein n=1 Tax=Volvox carteri f. nagariensis TaxID=3068 RepID=D8U932_VOLCA|nr:uncharacterized protein VOLCADRAFT_96054 [Volvox carteri f. nagariensis]EFJ43679.1 hypothetical protein VOLCADRAFT_96054 [Volvox carteri f. nagariensis]|eukprot:XP_002955160.1 hypothetical protein VOLCADRAFT_96054 [Volvox carteri f. nagariensis]
MGGGFWALAAGYLFAYFNAKSIEERKARIDRVNKQLKHLYGPLLSSVTASRSAFHAMVKQHSPDGNKEAFQAAVQANPDGPEARMYRLWMTEVLQPLNERAAQYPDHLVDILGKEFSRVKKRQATLLGEGSVTGLRARL